MKTSTTHVSNRAKPCWRILTVEVLEDRRLLTTTPWQNPTLPLDVNNDHVVTPLDALIVINRLLTVGPGPLPTYDSNNPPQTFYDTNGDNMLSPLDALQVINHVLNPPSVTLTSAVPFSIDLTPQLTVTTSGSARLPDGTPVLIDVDLNGDGNFSGPGETNYMTASLFAGSASFELNPALPADTNGPYTVKMRAHLTDSFGVPGTSSVLPLLIDTTTSDALKNYVQTPDASYSLFTGDVVRRLEQCLYRLRPDDEEPDVAHARRREQDAVAALGADRRAGRHHFQHRAVVDRRRLEPWQRPCPQLRPGRRGAGGAQP